MGTWGHKRMSRRSVTVKDVPADAFIKACADFLKRQPKFDVPKYHDIVKTGTFKELAPYDGLVLHPCCICCPQDLPSQGNWCGCIEEVVRRLQRYPSWYTKSTLLEGLWLYHSQGNA